MNNLLYTTKSHIDGKNADVTIYDDRIEWSKTKMSGLGKLAAATTLGVSAAVYRPQKSQGTEMLFLNKVTAVTTKKDGLMYSLVTVVAGMSAVSFRVSHSDAAYVKNLLMGAVSLASA